MKYIWRYLESQAIVKKWQGMILMVEGECAIIVFQHRQRQLRDLFRCCHVLYFRLNQFSNAKVLCYQLQERL